MGCTERVEVVDSQAAWIPQQNRRCGPLLKRVALLHPQPRTRLMLLADRYCCPVGAVPAATGSVPGVGSQLTTRCWQAGLKPPPAPKRPTTKKPKKVKRHVPELGRDAALPRSAAPISSEFRASPMLRLPRPSAFIRLSSGLIPQHEESAQKRVAPLHPSPDSCL